MDFKKLIIAAALIAGGSLGRMLLLGLPNVETLTIASLLAGAWLGGFYVFLVPFAIVALTDFSLGNDLIFIFTWSAWIVVAGLGLWARQAQGAKFVLTMTGLGLGACLFFYAYTNFGVWLLFDMYAKDWSGLLRCYLMGLPFLRYSLLGNLVMVPVVSSVVVLVQWLYLKFKVKKEKLKVAV